MTAPAPSTLFATANPHALATILEASQTKRIIASRDIFDLQGIKLWARDLPVSEALQRKLIDRKLRTPLETCLFAEDGITAHSLVQATTELVERDTPLGVLLGSYADKLVREAAHIPLHSVAQLLLTAGQASRPESFDHAVQAMALNGALMLAQGGGTQELRLAMISGLLHDLGEMYIDPKHGEADAEHALDLQSYQQLVVHPHVGHLLIAQLTDYPAAVARAIAEHHERLDGSGYPRALQRDQVSPLGRLLAVTEATLSVLRSGRAPLARASVALRVVPGEFDLHWVGRIAKAAQSQPALCALLGAREMQQRLTALDAALQASQECATALMGSAESPALKDALGLSLHLLARLRAGWNASGLWSCEALALEDAAEVEAVEDELHFRLQAIQRAALLRAGKLPPTDMRRLNLLCDQLVARKP